MLNGSETESLETGFVDERSESHYRAKRGRLPQGLDYNPAVGQLKKPIIIMNDEC